MADQDDNTNGGKAKPGPTTMIPWPDEDKLGLIVRLLCHQGNPISWDGFEIKTGHSLRACQGLLERLKKQFVTGDETGSSGAEKLNKTNIDAPKPAPKKRGPKPKVTTEKGEDGEAVEKVTKPKAAPKKKVNKDADVKAEDEGGGEGEEKTEKPKRAPRKKVTKAAEAKIEDGESGAVEAATGAAKPKATRGKKAAPAKKVEKQVEDEDKDSKRKTTPGDGPHKTTGNKGLKTDDGAQQEPLAVTTAMSTRGKSKTPTPDTLNDQATKGKKRGQSKTPVPDAGSESPTKKMKAIVEVEV